jgi:hypothetical protein
VSRLQDRLADVDRRLVPAAARRLRSAVDAGERARAAAVATVRATGRRSVRAVGSGLDRLDARLAARGPLALLREVPQLALLLVAAVFAGGALAAVRLAEPEPPPVAQGELRGPAGEDVLGTASLGVPPGEDVDTWLAQARTVVEELAERAPDRRYLALVTLDAHVPIADVARLTVGVDPVRAYLRAPGLETAETVELPLAGVSTAAVLPALCTATSARKAEDAESLRSLAATIEVMTPEEQLQRDDFVQEADRATAEAQAFGGDCATLFALVVEGEARSLAALLQRPGVRGVEAAPAGITLLDLQVAPLLPSTTGTAPAQPGS